MERGVAWLDDPALAEPLGVVFVSGAGASVDGPTSCEMGNGYVIRVLDHAFLGELSDSVLRVFEQCQMPGGAPRFEVVLGPVLAIHGPDVLRELLRDILEAEPNPLHEFFAWHLLAGGRHVTANVDQAIERASQRPAQGDAADVCHFHSVLTPEGDLSELGVVLNKIQGGLPPEMATQLDARLFDPSTKAIMFAGYSGSDYFDINPYLLDRARQGAFAGIKVYWIDHHSDPRPAAPKPPPANLAIVPTLLDLGVEITVIGGQTRQTLDGLAARWSWPPLSPVQPRRPTWQSRTLRLDAEDRWRAQVELFAQFHFARPLRQLAHGHEEAASGGPLAGVFADADWDDGAYRSAKRRWIKNWPDDELESVLNRGERIAACDWVAGRWGRARRRLDDLIEQSAHASTGESLKARLRILDTYSRLLGHMEHAPLARRRATEADKARILDLFQSTEARRAGLGADWVHRIEHGRSKLGATLDESALPEAGSSALQDARQTSSLAGALLYRQNELSEEHCLDPQANADLFDGFVAAQGRGNLARFLVLPGALRVISLWQAAAIAFDPRIHYAFIHRFRMLGACILAAPRRDLVRSVFRRPHRAHRTGGPGPGGWSPRWAAAGWLVRSKARRFRQ